MRNAVILFVKNEVEDILWWISWHLSIGFSDIIIYDDDSNDGTWELINSVKTTYNITCLKSIKSTWFNDRQKLTYLDALSRVKNKFEWVIFLDADEYLSVPDNDLEKFLSNYSDVDSISLNWKCFGSNGFVFKPHSPNVFENYLRYSRRDFEYNHIVKSFIRPNHTHIEYINPHRFNVFGKSVTANHKEVEWQVLHPERTVSLADWDTAYINHFIIRSAAHYHEKIRRRSDIRGSGISINLFRHCDRNDNLSNNFNIEMYKNIYDGVYKMQNSLSRSLIRKLRHQDVNFFNIHSSLIKAFSKTAEFIEIYKIETAHKTFLMRDKETGQIIHKENSNMDEDILLLITPFMPGIGFLTSLKDDRKLFSHAEARVSSVLSYFVERNTDNTFSLKSPINNTYLSARSDHNYHIVTCNVEVSDEWEHYKLHRMNKDNIKGKWMLKVLLILSKMKNSADIKRITEDRVVDGIAAYLQTIDMRAAFECGPLDRLLNFPWFPRGKSLSF